MISATPVETEQPHWSENVSGGPVWHMMLKTGVSSVNVSEKESSWKNCPACQHHHQSAVGIGLHGLPLGGNIIRRLPAHSGDN